MLQRYQLALLFPICTCFAIAVLNCRPSPIASSLQLAGPHGSAGPRGSFRLAPLCELLAQNFQYATSTPSRQAVVDLLAPWAGALPPTKTGENLQAGSAPLFADGRIQFFLKEVGGVAQLDIIELGPLEASHTFMLQNAGARHITAVEGSPLAYLKCLAVKEIYGLDRATFLFGDFMQFLLSATEQNHRWDAALAIGVLYHMQEPVKLLHMLSQVTDKIVIWTHFYDAIAERRGGRTWGDKVTQHIDGRDYAVRCHQYGPKSSNFLGGPAPSACWLEKDTLLAVLRDLGFARVVVDSFSFTHVNGPEITLFASRH